MDLEKAKRLLDTVFRTYSSLSVQELDTALQEKIQFILLGDHLTFRYMLFTALLAKVVDSKIHMRAVQAQAKLRQAYDARSLCHKVIVPFEKSTMEGRLGDSNEPYLNKPARCEAIEKTNPVRNGNDREMLNNLYDLLESLNGKNKRVCKEALLFAMGVIMTRPVRRSESVVLPPITVSSDVVFERLSGFLRQSYEGQAPVAIMGAILKCFYSTADIDIHPANEAGSSSNEVGDIDIKFKDGRLYAVEVKDKTFTDTDINHAVGKVLSSHKSKAIFAFSYNATPTDVNFQQSVSYWKNRGIDLSFVSIPLLLEQSIAMQGMEEYVLFFKNVLDNLYIMRAKDETIRAFEEICN